MLRVSLCYQGKDVGKERCGARFQAEAMQNQFRKVEKSKSRKVEKIQDGKGESLKKKYDE